MSKVIEGFVEFREMEAGKNALYALHGTGAFPLPTKPQEERTVFFSANLPLNLPSPLISVQAQRCTTMLCCQCPSPLTLMP